MAHKHSIYDTDSHFIIDTITRKIVNASSKKTTLMQGDHNSERFTFECPRYIEEHDMSLCNRIEAHYINVSSTNKNEQSKDVYLVGDMQISPEDENVVIFSWLISGNATKYAGSLNFIISFKCLTGDVIDYAWHTGIYSSVSVGEGIDNGEAVIAEYSDVLAVWERQVLGLPYAEYSLPIVYLEGDTAGISKDNKVTLNYRYGDRLGTCTLKWQGSSSLLFPKKNYTVKFDNAFEVVEGWGVQDKYCLKADWVDFSHCRNVVSAKLWGDVVRSRTVSDLVTRLSTLPNCGAIDGFPCSVVINGEWQGIYNFSIPKDGYLFGMGSGEKEAIICAENTEACYFSSEATLGADFDLEYASDTFPEAEIQTSLNRLINAVRNSDGSDIDTVIAQYVDINSAIDYLIFAQLLHNRDGIQKNYILATYDGEKWFFSAYDLDLVFGLEYPGDNVVASNKSAWETSHKLFDLLYKHKFERVVARYKEIVKAVMSRSAVEFKFTNYALLIPKPAYISDAEMWKTIPNTGIDHIGQILNWYKARIDWLDETYATEEKRHGTKGLAYKLDDTGLSSVCLGMGVCMEPDITIAYKYNNKAVNDIVANAFDGQIIIESIVVPEGVQFTRNYSFARCTSLKSITLPNTLKFLAYGLFVGCTALKTISLPNGVETVADGIFSGCTSLAKVYIPGTFPKISGSMFKNCSALKDIFYDGTMAQWEALVKGTDWNTGTGAYTIHCIDGDIVKS